MTHIWLEFRWLLQHSSEVAQNVDTQFLVLLEHFTLHVSYKAGRRKVAGREGGREGRWEDRRRKGGRNVKKEGKEQK